MGVAARAQSTPGEIVCQVRPERTNHPFAPAEKPAAMEEFASPKNPWAWDVKTRQSRVQSCAGGLCTGVQGQGYLYLYRLVAPNVAVVWAVPSLKENIPAPFMLDPEKSALLRWGQWLWDAQTIEQRASAYRATTPALYAVCHAAGNLNCRQWRGALGPEFQPSDALQLFEPTPEKLRALGLREMPGAGARCENCR